MRWDVALVVLEGHDSVFFSLGQRGRSSGVHDSVWCLSCQFLHEAEELSISLMIEEHLLGAGLKVETN